MKYFVSSFLLMVILFSPACTDLTEEAFDVLPAENYYQDQNSIVAALIRPYEHGQWCGWNGDRWMLSELTADHFVWTQKGKHGWDDGNWVRLHEHTWNADDGRIYGSWIGPYQGIGQCNVLLRDFEQLDFTSFDLTEADKAQYRAELRTLRAWYYLFLIDYFRSVPLATDNETVLGNASRQEVFDFIETELQESLDGLPRNGPLGRWDQAGAAALLVRLYLNADAWIGTPRYDDCARIAREIIDGTYGTYTIDPDYRGPFRSGINGYRSPENIFEFPHALNIYDFGWMYGSFMHYQARYSLGNESGSNNGIHLTPSRDLNGAVYPYDLGKPYESFADDDRRKQTFRTTASGGEYEGFFLIGPQYAFDEARGYGFDSTTLINGTEEYNEEPLSFVDQVGRFSDGDEGLAQGSSVITGEENSGVRFIKFPWLPQLQDLFQNNSAPEIRLAEIYYALAECRFRAGDRAAAAQLLDVVRERNFAPEAWPANGYANNPTRLTEAEFITSLGREFLGERHRRTDLVRWNRFGDEWWSKVADGDDRSVFPIPNRAINANPLLKQNEENR